MGLPDVLEDPHYTLPLYRKTEAAEIIDVPAQTFRNWSMGYAYKRIDGTQVTSDPIVTTSQPSRLMAPSVPFIGLAEAYVVSAFTKAGVPMRRIRPAILWLQEHMGLHQALASEQLKTDGAEVLWDYGQQSDDPDDSKLVDGLVVVRSGQQVFRTVVNDYLTRVTYERGWTRMIDLPQYQGVEVVVDPWINGGQPTVAARGIRVRDIVTRLQAGELDKEVAYDFDLPTEQVSSLRRAA